MNTPKTKPCPAIHDGVPCGGEMTYEPRQLEVRPTLNDPIGEQGSDPCWVCDTCTRVEWVDDDPGTMGMFPNGARPAVAITEDKVYGPVIESDESGLTPDGPGF